MNLLIITQKVDKNDSNLGFFHDWIDEFSNQCNKVEVICLYMGVYNFPEDVEIFSLGKEKNKSKIKYLYNFYKYILKLHKKYDYVFVHMNPIYVVLGAPVWKILSKKVGLWYAHGSTPVLLKIALKFVNLLFTSTKEGCQIKSNKIKIVGQGIDFKKFVKVNPRRQYNNKNFKFITVGRISPSKDLETIIKALNILNKDNFKFVFNIIGRVESDKHKIYLEKIKKNISKFGLDKKINFIGPIEHDRLIEYLWDSDLFISASLTGSLDKAIIEAIASGLLVITCNDAAKNILNKYGSCLLYDAKDFLDLEKKIKNIFLMDEVERDGIIANLQEFVRQQYSLNSLINNILKYYDKY